MQGAAMQARGQGTTNTGSTGPGHQEHQISEIVLQACGHSLAGLEAGGQRGQLPCTFLAACRSRAGYPGTCTPSAPSSTVPSRLARAPQPCRCASTAAACRPGLSSWPGLGCVAGELPAFCGTASASATPCSPVKLPVPMCLLQIWEEMQTAGVPANLVTYVSGEQVQQWQQGGCASPALQITRGGGDRAGLLGGGACCMAQVLWSCPEPRMHGADNLPLHDHLQNTLIDVYGKLGQWAEAMRILHRMRAEVSSLASKPRRRACWEARGGVCLHAGMRRGPPSVWACGPCRHVRMTTRDNKLFPSILQGIEPVVRTYNTLVGRGAEWVHRLHCQQAHGSCPGVPACGS